CSCFFSSRRRHTRSKRDWSSDVCSSDLITEAIPIAATSLLPLILMPLGHVLSPEEVSAQYGNDIIFLFLGGFILAIAMERWNLRSEERRVGKECRCRWWRCVWRG